MKRNWKGENYTGAEGWSCRTERPRVPLLAAAARVEYVQEGEQNVKVGVTAAEVLIHMQQSCPRNHIF